jgi:hypothetical protein
VQIAISSADFLGFILPFAPDIQTVYSIFNRENRAESNEEEEAERERMEDAARDPDFLS